MVSKEGLLFSLSQAVDEEESAWEGRPTCSVGEGLKSERNATKDIER